MELITIVTIINSVVLLGSIIVMNNRTCDSVDRDIQILEEMTRGVGQMLKATISMERKIRDRVVQETGAIQSKFDKQNNETTKEIEAVRFATKKTLGQIDKNFDEIEVVHSDHFKTLGHILNHLELEVVQEERKVVVTPEGLRKVKKTTKK